MKKNLFTLLLISSSVSLVLFMANGAQAASSLFQSSQALFYSSEKVVLNLNIVNSSLNWTKQIGRSNPILHDLGCSCVVCSPANL